MGGNELLSSAFLREASVPAEEHFFRGVRATAYWTFAPSIEIVLVEADQLPAEANVVAAELVMSGPAVGDAWESCATSRPAPCASKSHPQPTAAPTSVESK
jgi:hypothetical protein